VRAVLPIVLTLAGPPAAAEQESPGAIFLGLGDLPGGGHASVALDVSADGRVVVGHGSTPDGVCAFRWEAGQLDAIGPATSVAMGTSADGTVVAGTVTDAAGSRPFRWAAGVLERLEPRAGGEARAVSADGRSIVGQGPDGAAWMWRDGRTWPLEPPGSARQLLPRGLSHDGTILVGSASGAEGTRAFRSPGPAPLPCLPGGGAWAEARAVNATGAAAGASDSWWGIEPCLWIGLEPHPLGGISDHHELFGYAIDLSSDGAVVVGAAEDDQGDLEAFIWRADRGMRSIRRALQEEFELHAAGWILIEATGVSADGRTIVGYGRNPRGETEAWLARWPARPCAAAAGVGGATFTRSLAELGGFVDLHDAAFEADGSLLVAADGAIWRFAPPEWRRQPVVRDIERLRAVAPGPQDRVYVAAGDEILVHLRDGRRLDRWSASGADRPRLLAPRDVAAHGERVAVADSGHDRVVILDQTGSLRSILGGRGSEPGRFRRPTGLAWSDAGELFVVDADNQRVQRFSADGALLEVFGERGHWSGAFLEPVGAAWHDGAIYVGDAGTHRVQGFDANGAPLASFGGRGLIGSAGLGRLRRPAHIDIAPGGVAAAVCEPAAGRVQVLGPCAGRALAEPPVASLGEVVDLRAGLLAAIDRGDHTLLVYNLRDPGLPLRAGGFGDRPGQLNRPGGVALDPQRGRVLLCDRGNRRLLVFDLIDGPPREIRLSRSLELEAIPAALDPLEPLDVAVGADGTAFVLASFGSAIVRVDPQVAEATLLPSADRGGEPRGLAVDAARARLYVLDGGPGRVTALDFAGRQIASWPLPQSLRSASAIAIGPSSTILLLDAATGGVGVLGPDGEVVDAWPDGRRGRFGRATDLACDEEGRLAVLDAGHECIHVLDAEGALLEALGAPMGVRAARAGWRGP
jgi:DNA-binding beta-propeller fold protein YncE/uncharacterized membrane protein